MVYSQILEQYKKEKIMSNTFVKIMNNKISNHCNHNVICDIQSDLRTQTKILGQILYDDIMKNKNFKDVDVNTLLKCYVLEQILTQDSNLQKKTIYQPTPNPDIKFNSEDKKYYIKRNKNEVCCDNITKINDDGSYIVVEAIRNSVLKIKKTYDKEHRISEIQISLGNGYYETNVQHAAELLEFKKLYSLKYKYAGFSGNSKDILATIKNKFCIPKDTSIFIDKYCNCYKWSYKKKAFIRNISSDSTSPLLVDYEFLSNGKVIKKEYTGKK